MDNTKEFTHISLCSGYGGIDLGLKRVIPNLRTIAYVEIEAFACSNLVEKMEKGEEWEGESLDAAPIWTNLKTFPWAMYRGKVDILSGGFPCQPFSAAGKQKGDEDPRHLFPFIKEGIRTTRPAIVWLENVDGISSAKLKGDHWNDPAGTPVLLHVLRELGRLGYRATAIPSSASEVGAPHQRNRWFILAVADSHIKGLERELYSGGIKGEQGTSEAIAAICRTTGNSWPSRPGQKQYWWEPTRTVGNTANKGLSKRGVPPMGKRKRKVSESKRSMCSDDESSTIEPSMGGNVNGVKSRMGNAYEYR